MTNIDMEKAPPPADGSIDSSTEPPEDSTPPAPAEVKSIHQKDDSSQTTANADPPAAAVPRPPAPVSSALPANVADVAPATKPGGAAPPTGQTSTGAGEGGPAPVTAPPPKSKMVRAMEAIQARYRLVYTEDNKAYAVDDSGPNPQTFHIGTKEFSTAVRQLVYMTDRSVVLVNEELGEISSQLEALADLTGKRASVWLRVAESDDGIVIDLGDDSHARIAVGPGTVKILKQGCPTLFYRNPNFLPFVMPAEKGDINKLLSYLNLEGDDRWLLILWIAYTLAHAKVPSTNYVILVLRGERGTGKTTLCNIIIGSLVGPSSIGVQAFPGSQKDLAIAVQNAHVSMFDNIRAFKASQADVLCRTATSASISTRMLYTNGGQFTFSLHGGIVLNGIHSFIDQDDLAQRCLSLTAQPLDHTQRSTEKQLKARFQKDLPVIFKGLLDLIADILVHLPNVTAKYPERMLEFVLWLAAAEKALGLPEGQLQLAYSDNLVGAMQDNLQDYLLADTTIQFAKLHIQSPWDGTPADLLIELGKVAGQQAITTRDWPQNPIQLSLRLKKLKSKLSGAGVEIALGKQDKKRNVTVQYTGRSA